jgi:hypothetical protein
MDKNCRASQLEAIKNGNSIFKNVPDFIGNIVYCDTTQSREIPLTIEEIRKRQIKAIVISAITLAIAWVVLFSVYVLALILSIPVLWFLIRRCKYRFKGTDYFVGIDGFSFVHYVNDRHNIVENNEHLFSDVSSLFTGETITKTNSVYTCTEFYFSIFGKILYII